MGQDHHRLLRQRFPLVARPKPLCPPLPERIAEVARLAEAAARDHNLTTAATACNRAALIASDCGLPALAETWCRQHFEIYWNQRPLTGAAVTLALQPLINIARLQIRAHAGNDAHRLLNDLYKAVRARTTTTVAGATLNFGEFTTDETAHREAVTKLWTVQLADATRALSTTGNWDQALRHVITHKGVGGRLLDGRQIAIIAHHHAGNPAMATRILEESTPAEPWEHVLIGVLRLILHAPHRHPCELTESYLRLEHPQELLFFQTRLGTTVIEALHDLDEAGADAVATRVADIAIQTGDGYVAREVLLHAPTAGRLPNSRLLALQDVVAGCSLDAGSFPDHAVVPLERAFAHARETAMAVLAGGRHPTEQSAR